MYKTQISFSYYQFRWSVIIPFSRRFDISSLFFATEIEVTIFDGVPMKFVMEIKFMCSLISP